MLLALVARELMSSLNVMLRSNMTPTSFSLCTLAMHGANLCPQNILHNGLWGCPFLLSSICIYQDET